MDFNDRVSFTFNNQCTRTFLGNWGYFLVSVGIYRNFFLINNRVKEFCPEISVSWFLFKAGSSNCHPDKKALQNSAVCNNYVFNNSSTRITLQSTLHFILHLYHTSALKKPRTTHNTLAAYLLLNDTFWM